jgi:hypothetical protein
LRSGGSSASTAHRAHDRLGIARHDHPSPAGCTTVTTTVDRQSHRSLGRSLPRAVT